MTINGKLRWRAFTSFIVLFSFVVLFTSGVILYILPHGRIAYWIDFHLLGLDKDQWDTLHICFSLLFVLFSVFHIINNWRTLWCYVRDKASGAIRMKTELISAFAVSVACVIGSVLFLPPFKNIKDLSEHFKESWATTSEEVPTFPHAELQPIGSLSASLEIDSDEAVRRLREAGLEVKDPDETLKDIADRNDTTPSAVLHEVAPELGWIGRGHGLGRRYGKKLRSVEDPEPDKRGGRGLGQGDGRGLGRGDGQGLGRGDGRGLGRGREQNADL